MLLANPLVTPRLTLRCLTSEDVGQHYVDWLNDPETTRFLEVRWTRHDLDGVRTFVETVNCSANNLLLGMFAHDNGSHIGNIKVGPVNPHHRRAEMGLIVGDKSRWGKGYGREAIAAVTAYAHEALKLVKVVAGCYAANEGSRRAFLAAGYKEEGRQVMHWRSGEHWDDEILLGHISERHA